MYTVISGYEDQAFVDMSEESEEKKIEHFIIKKLLWSVPNQGIVEQAEQNGGLRPQQAERGLTKMMHHHLRKAYYFFV